MKLPICEICAKEEDLLCAGCQKKLDEGRITASDIKLGRKLYSLLKSEASLKDVEILRILESDKLCVIVVGKGSAAKLIGKRGQMVRKISKIVGKDVRVVEASDDFEHLVENVLKPASVLGINILYTKEGEIYRVRVPSLYRQMIPEPEEISKALSLATEKQFEIVFE